ncbi:hypothetical protein ACU8KH_01811 [Lachancea thermotolerans]
MKLPGMTLCFVQRQRKEQAQDKCSLQELRKPLTTTARFSDYLKVFDDSRAVLNTLPAASSERSLIV